MQRKEWIVRHVQKEGAMDIKALASRLKTSESTVRRDLKQLASQNAVRIERGVVILAREPGETVFKLRGEGSRQGAKRRIAQVAVRLIREGETIAFDTGSTVLELARAISPDLRLTCLTNSLVIAGELSLKPKIEIILLGGSVNPLDMATTGPMAEREVREFNVSKFFLGAVGLSAEKGITNINLNLIQLRRTLVEVSDEVIVLADDSKFGKVGLTCVAEFEEVKKIVSNEGLAEEHRKMLETRGVDFVLAP